MKQEQVATTLRGIGVAPGMAVGVAIRLRSAVLDAERRTIALEAVAAELERFEQAVADVKRQIAEERARVAEEIGENEAQVFDAHLAFLDDPAYTGEIRRRIQQDQTNAEAVVADVTEATRQMLAALPSEYLQARADDIRDVGRRLLINLSGGDAVQRFQVTAEPCILVADELMPSDLSGLGKNVVGLVTARGSKTAHTAIMARTLGIPAVYGLGDALEQIADGSWMIVNGDDGTVTVNADQEALQRAREQAERLADAATRSREAADEPAVTRDGVRVEVFANIGGLDDLSAALANGADGVGLFRTEFLYLENDHWPTEDEQFEVYKSVLEAFGQRPVLIRTLDIGGDKHLPYATLPKEDNPFLGLRAIRYSLAQPDIFKAQLRALLRASVYGTLWIMFPMVETLAELRQAKQLLDTCREELVSAGHSVADRIPVGIMVETPAAAVTADLLAEEADFFSIGTNDLTQYTLAADRGNPAVADLYNPAHPAVLRLIRQVCEAARRAQIPVGMCGEFAGEVEFTELLVGLGVQELSMSAAFIPKVKARVRDLTQADAVTVAERALRSSSPEEVRTALQNH
jgi:phosphotransferase system enzyme I (PtsI)